MSRPHFTLEQLVTDPFGELARARHRGWLAELDPVLAVLTHEDVHAFFADERLHANFPDFLRSFGIESGPFFEWMAISPLNRDGADHRRWRSVMNRTFTPSSVERIRPFLRQSAEELVDGFAARGGCEFVGEFADAYPSLGLCELIGVPHEDRAQFRGWANTIGIGFSPLALVGRIHEVDEALTQLIAYAGQLVVKRLAEPRDDLVSRIAHAAREEGWSDELVRGSIAGLVFAGHETTRNQLGWMVAVLSEHADLWEAIAAGSQDVNPVVEEVLRYRSTVTGVGRTAACPVEHKGEKLEAGARVLLSLWGANHDPRVYPEPDRLDVERHRHAPHLAFGFGPHHCLGAALARAELQEALRALASRITCPKLEDGAVWKPPIGINGPDRLPITFAARPASATA